MNLNDIAKSTQSEDQARQFLEAQRWPNGAICPHCGVEGQSYRLKAKPDSKHPVRPGVWKCGGCRKQFTVKVGTIFEDSHIPLVTWLRAIHLLCASKKGMSAHQLHRMLGITYKSAWFMAHRIRYAMTQEPLSSKLSGAVEVDETYVGGKARFGTYVTKPGERPKDRPAPTAGKEAVVPVLQRGGRVQSMHVAKVTAKTLRPIIDEMVAEDAHLMTDTSTVLASAWKQTETLQGESYSQGIYSLRRRNLHFDKYCGRLFRQPQARTQWRLPSRKQTTLAPLSQ